MDYSFNCEIAVVYGVDEAVFIHNLYWWIRKNEANDRHYHDGKSWTYNSMRAFSELFPFWTPKQIRRIIKKLSDCGALLVGHYNEAGFDRTQWYALDEAIYRIYACGSMCPNGQMDVPKQSNGCAQTGEPIPDNKPDSKPNNLLSGKPDTHAEEIKTVVDYLNLCAGTKYRAGSEATAKHIRARLNEGFTVEDCKAVVDHQCATWNHEPDPGQQDMRRYLRPETLFGSKFESYLNQPAGGSRPMRKPILDGIRPAPVWKGPQNDR